MANRNRRTRNPGWKRNGHWVVCDFCGAVIRAKDSKKTWEGYVVCPNDYETRHPQDFVRSVPDTIAPVGNVRTDPAEVYVSGFCTTRSAVAGEAIAGCLLPSFTVPKIPESTF